MNGAFQSVKAPLEPTIQKEKSFFPIGKLKTKLKSCVNSVGKNGAKKLNSHKLLLYTKKHDNHLRII